MAPASITMTLTARTTGLWRVRLASRLLRLATFLRISWSRLPFALVRWALRGLSLRIYVGQREIGSARFALTPEGEIVRDDI